MRWLYSLFCWCSGARLYILNQCPTDFNKFFGIGIIIFLTGTLATLSGGYALYTVFNKLFISISFGLLWGIFIFFIDWYIVSSLRKENKIRKELLMALPRFILAIMIAVIVSKPLELKLFEKEINQEIELIKIDKASNLQEKVNKYYGEIAALNKENQLLNKETEEKTKRREEIFDNVIKEAEGRSITNKIGKGPVFREKKEELNQIDLDLKEIKDRNRKLIEKNNQRIQQLQQGKDEKVTNGNKITENYDGFLARIEAFGQLCSKNKTINATNWFIILLFIIIETSPMIVKILSQRGAYDELLEFEELKKISEINSDSRKVRKEYEKKFELLDYVDQLKFQSAKDVNKDFVDLVTKAHYDVNNAKVESWKQKEFDRSKTNTQKFIEPVDNFYNDYSNDIHNDL